MSLSSRVGSGAMMQLGARVFSASVSFVIIAVVLARALPKEEYGLFNFYLTLFLLVMTLVDFGANRAAIRLITTGELARDRGIRSAIAFKGLVGSLAFGAMALFIWGVETGGMTRLLLILAAAHTLSHRFGGASIGFEVEVDYRIPARSVVIGYALFLIAGLTLAWLDVRSAPPYLVAFGAGISLQNYMLYVAARSRHPIASTVDREAVRRLLAEALPLGISAVAVSIYFYADTVLLRPMRGEAAVAEYSVAYRLMSFGLMVPVLFSQVLFPVFARCHERSRDLLRRAVGRSTYYLALVGGLAATFLFATAGDLLALIFGEDYRVAAPSLRILAVGMGIVYLNYPHTNALIAAGRASTFTRITIVSACLNIAMNLILIPRLGPPGAALTTLITEGFVFGAGVVAARYYLGVTGLSRQLIGPLLLAVFLLVALRVSDAHGVSIWGRFVIAGGVSLFGAVGLGAFPFRLDVEEEELH